MLPSMSTNPEPVAGGLNELPPVEAMMDMMIKAWQLQKQHRRVEPSKPAQSPGSDEATLSASPSNPCYDKHERDYGTYTAISVHDWSVILRLADLWGFQSIRALAVRQLEPIATAVDKVVLGKQFGIEEWLLDGYRALCARQDSLTEEEGERLGVRDVVRIFTSREHNESFMAHLSSAELRERFKPPILVSQDDPLPKLASNCRQRTTAESFEAPTVGTRPGAVAALPTVPEYDIPADEVGDSGKPRGVVKLPTCRAEREVIEEKTVREKEQACEALENAEWERQAKVGERKENDEKEQQAKNVQREKASQDRKVKKKVNSKAQNEQEAREKHQSLEQSEQRKTDMEDADEVYDYWQWKEYMEEKGYCVG
ncbi:hypothetical protein HWV62_38971 [Athelia sp. TMB]|nr:hypothetical protein HWV62_38971 [Athelia sp. TMB]